VLSAEYRVLSGLPVKGITQDSGLRTQRGWDAKNCSEREESRNAGSVSTEEAKRDSKS
jgi:hypothetical protein